MCCRHLFELQFPSYGKSLLLRTWCQCHWSSAPLLFHLFIVVFSVSFLCTWSLYLSPCLFYFVLCLSPSLGLCILVHPCMEIDWRHEYITASHPCNPPFHPPIFTHHPPLHPPISPRSLSQHLSQSSDLMHFNRRVYLPFSLSPSFLWLWISGILQTNNNNKTTPLPPPYWLPIPFLNQYLPSANKSYNFLAVRRVRRRHIYLPLVYFFCLRSLVLAAWLLAKWRGWMAVKHRAIASPSESSTLKNGRRLSDDSTAKTHIHIHTQTCMHTYIHTHT